MREPQLGGPVDPEAKLYIERRTDDEFLALLRACEFVNLITSRQMGKTSLVFRAISELRPEGMNFAYCDLSTLHNEPVARVFFRTLVEELANELDLDIDLDAFWSERAQKTNGASLIDFFRTALKEIDSPIIIILDEIDSTLASAELAYTDDLFTALRSIYTLRPREPTFKRLGVCLVGVATPDELIKARRTTPYNVGRTLWLADFDPSCDDLAPLARMLADEKASAAALLARVLHWTGGQPFLTMWLACELRRAGANEPGDVDQWVKEHFANVEMVRGETHFDQTQRFLFRRGGSAEVLDLYERILTGAPAPDQPANRIYAHLRLSGLVRRGDDGLLSVRSRIYARVFDANWVSRSRPRRALRRARRLTVAASGLLAATVAVGTGYYQYKLAPIVQANDARIALRELGFDVVDLREMTLVRLRQRGQVQDAAALLGRAVPLLAVFGRGSSAQPLALDIARLPARDVAQLTALPRLTALDLAGTTVSDIEPLSRLPALERLDLSSTPVENIEPLARLAKLEYLDLGHSRVQDVAPLSRFPALRTLRVDGLKLERFEKADVSVFGTSRPRPNDAKRKTGEAFRDCPDCPEMVVVPAGEFEMGSREQEPDRLAGEGPVHPVRLGHPFALMRNEVTRGQFFAFVKDTGYRAAKSCFAGDGTDWREYAGKTWKEPGFSQDPSHPVVCLSWADARAYADWLSKKTGQSYRLPSEAEWEYAARAGSQHRYSYGDNDRELCTYANVVDLSMKSGFPGFKDAWRYVDCVDGYVYTAPVGKFKPNAFGLNDMHGNAWEWVQDCFHDSYQGAPVDGRPWDSAVCAKRTVRSGSWDRYQDGVRSAVRNGVEPAIGNDDVGFRLARTL